MTPTTEGAPKDMTHGANTRGHSTRYKTIAMCCIGTPYLIKEVATNADTHEAKYLLTPTTNNKLELSQ
jgi:hypothetical protein